MSVAQAWIALVGGLGTAILGILKYFNYRTRRDRVAAVGTSFGQLVESLAANDPIRQSAAAILLRRFFDSRSEQGVSGRTPYCQEAVGIIAALLRSLERGEFQKLLADGLAYAPTLHRADLQRCNLRDAFLGERRSADERAGRRREPVDLSSADLFEADLSDASLRGIVARETVFYRATMRGTVLRDADLRGADFREADLEGARFAGALLDGAKFADARNVPEEVRGRLGPDDTVPVSESPASAG